MDRAIGFLRVFFTGLCMGAADLVPGISGGTIAFIMGIYEQLIHAIRSLNIKMLIARKIPFSFLFFLFSGMACSLLLFSHTIATLLKDSEHRPLLYAFFMGLIAASVCFLLGQIKNWSKNEVISLILGAMVAYLLSGQPLAYSEKVIIQDVWIHPWLIFSGAAAISAMLLPGISGSYLLMILGVYPISLEALTDFSSGLKNGLLDGAALVILANLMTGIVCGALLFSHVINWLLKHYHQMTLALLIGFMIGAVRTAWPFWEFTTVLHPFRPEKGMIPSMTRPILPDISTPLFWKALICALAGFLIVFAIDVFFREEAVMHTKKS
ncbi:Uncharacterized protein PHSC3_000486 [Chlamydiales bacterium STE3]|nr:Uncharacterized protein PHSC3_000486 [Chlamydiales bacterium STE3]